MRFCAFGKSYASCEQVLKHFLPFAEHAEGISPVRNEIVIGKTAHNRHNFLKSGLFQNLAGSELASSARNQKSAPKLFPQNDRTVDMCALTKEPLERGFLASLL